MNPEMPEDLKVALSIREGEVLKDFKLQVKEFVNSLIFKEDTLSYIDMALGVNKVALVRQALREVSEFLEGL